ncbi:ATP-binding protein [Pseudoflavonifractor phocaeensis]|uniref:DNA polymerase III subunit n=1 Tax=Pseudoflavonifractor phocaeensis TaxID=1870988 RepID=UPI00195D12D7|nr:DNA polymerase III subunit delta' [Pseudoflavonifractor phocaeensis]MBM6722072.1 DNA polymerase III subunit delta [Pseudoflavonifractor phocaeensis]
MNLTPLAGNGPLKRQLEGETARRGLSHAYLLCGPAGSGKRTLAGLLSAALVCSAGGEGIPCGRCSGCKKALAGIHPDISPVGEDGKDITVAQVRALRSDAYIKPNEAARKVYVLHRAQSMNSSAQNAMLKLLEEGPPYAAFLLLADNPAALLPTVRSRCETLTLAPVTPQEALSWLTARYPQRSRQQLAGAAERCEGLLGRAVQELEGEDGAMRREVQAAGELLNRLCTGSELEIAEFCVELERDKWDREGLDGLLEEFILLLRDALAEHYGVCRESDPWRKALARQAAALPPRRLMAAVRLAEELRQALTCNLGAGHLAGWLAAGLAEPV